MPSQKSFSPNTLIARDDSRFITNMVDGELLLMNIKTGDYIALRTAAMAIWEILVKPITITKLIATILDEYDVSEAEATTDTIAFLKQLLDQGMIKILTN